MPALVAALLLAAGNVGCALLQARPDPSAESAADAQVPESRPYLVLRLNERRVYLMGDGAATPPEAFPVAIGRKPYETPTGRFEVTEMVENPEFLRIDWNDPSRVLGRIPPGPGNPLGLRWIGFASAYGWTIGFHGTSKTELLGQAVSHGCVRMRNSDVVRLYERVAIGTPVIVEP